MTETRKRGTADDLNVDWRSLEGDSRDLVGKSRNPSCICSPLESLNPLKTYFIFPGWFLILSTYGAVHSFSTHVLGPVLGDRKAERYSCSPEGAHSPKIGRGERDCFWRGRRDRETHATFFEWCHLESPRVPSALDGLLAQEDTVTSKAR